ncbi:MAG TPA: carboxypeptidase-like regulatory domain-containing protein [Gemmataceae bacterium]
MRARGWLAAAVTAALAAAGCSGGGGGPYATVSGVVTYNGQPVNGAKVTFHGTTEVEGRRAGPFSALTDSQGKYLLANVGEEPGIPPGMYKVTVTKLEMEGAAGEVEGLDQGQLEAAGTAVNVLPADYEQLATTKLSATLKEGANEGVNFELKGKASKRRPPVLPVP